MIKRIVEFDRKSDIYLIAFWPTPEADGDSRQAFEWAYRALLCTYNCNFQIIQHPSQALPLKSMPYISLEQKNPGTQSLRDFEHPKKAVYLVGNAKYSSPGAVLGCDYKVHIEVPNMEHPLYGDQAAAIAFNDRYMKNGTSI